MIIRVGTRKSRLAMIQTEIVTQKIKKHFPEAQIEIIPMSTKGDEILNRSLSSFGGKGIFTGELEYALLNKEIDLAVHSAKDMPMEFPEGLIVRPVLKRGNPADVLITTSRISGRDLPQGSVVGTSSLRRELQIKEMNPFVTIKMLRGNVETRIKKLKNGEYDAILLAAAGIERLSLTKEEGLCFEYLDTQDFVPAAGQGILAVEFREDELEEVTKVLCSEDTDLMFTAERSFLVATGGGCNAPCGAFSKVVDNRLIMNVMYQDDRGVNRRAEDSIVLDGNQVSAEQLAVRLAQKVKCKTVYLVGAGPGDQGLLTGKGLECIRAADVIVYDNLVQSSILNEARLDAELIYAGKRASNHHMKQEEINQCLIESALQGRLVVRLKGGDPFIFGRGAEEALALSMNGLPYEIVPGVSSFYAAPAYAGIPVTYRKMASSVHVITGHEGSHKAKKVINYEILAKEEGTLVFMMGLHNLAEIVQSLTEAGKPGDTATAVIQEGTTGRQKTVCATLNTIVELVKEAKLQSPAVIVIGDVVSLKEKLNWIEHKPLSGLRILHTGTVQITKKLSLEMEKYGAESISFSLIHTRRLETTECLDALHNIKEYNWIVFTSSNGVTIFFDYLNREGIDIRTLMHIKFAVIGAGSAKTLAEKGIYYDFMPTHYTSEDLVKEWIPGLSKEERVLLIRAREASEYLTDALTDTGITYRNVALYETIRDNRKKEELNRILCDVDYITLASGSAARAYAAMTAYTGENRPRIICIGPVTAKEAKEAGISVYATADTHTAEGIADIIMQSASKELHKQG